MAQDAVAVVTDLKPTDPIKDDPTLPRVLLIGDSISIGYHVAVRTALEGVANVHRPNENCGPTINALEKLQGWLEQHGERPWDVIHFNFGLHDLKRMENGEHQVSLADYSANLRTITHALAETGAALIWCSTTPVPDVPMEDMAPPRLVTDVPMFNAAAFEAVNASIAVGGVAIHDLYNHALPELANIQLEKNVHFSDEGSTFLAESVVASVLRALDGERGPPRPNL